MSIETNKQQDILKIRMDAVTFHAFSIAKDAAEICGTLGIIVDTKDQQAARFYEKFGFMPLSNSKNRLVLPFSAMKSLL